MQLFCISIVVPEYFVILGGACEKCNGVSLTLKYIPGCHALTQLMPLGTSRPLFHHDRSSQPATLWTILSSMLDGEVLRTINRVNDSE